MVARLKDAMIERACGEVSDHRKSHVTTPPPEKSVMNQPPTGASCSSVMVLQTDSCFSVL